MTKDEKKERQKAIRRAREAKQQIAIGWEGIRLPQSTETLDPDADDFLDRNAI